MEQKGGAIIIINVMQNCGCKHLGLFGRDDVPASIEGRGARSLSVPTAFWHGFGARFTGRRSYLADAGEVGTAFFRSRPEQS